MAAYKKDPNATLDYTFDWGPYLTTLGDTIVSVVWVLSSGLVQVSVSNTTTTATIFVSGGPMKAGVTPDGETIDLISVFEGVGAFSAGKIDEKRLSILEKFACPSCGSCSGTASRSRRSWPRS